MSDAEIIAIRDEHLPSQGESFDCIAFARAVLASEAPAAQEPGTPGGRFMALIDQLKLRFPDQEPVSARAYEGRFIQWLDALLAAPNPEPAQEDERRAKAQERIDQRFVRPYPIPAPAQDAAIALRAVLVALEMPNPDEAMTHDARHLALVAAAVADQAKECNAAIALLREAHPYVEVVTRQLHDGTTGQGVREEAVRRLARIDAFLADKEPR